MSIAWVLPLDLVLANPGVKEGELTSYEVHDVATSTGWTISATLGTDYCVWVRRWTATHPVHGVVSGGVGKHARDIKGSPKAKKEFLAAHPLEEFDFGDI